LTFYYNKVCKKEKERKEKNELIITIIFLVASQHDGILLSNENLENLLLSQQAHGDISQMHLSSSFESFYH
jgi:hypothetical protein